MVVHLPRYKIAYVPVPKAACTSIKAAILEKQPKYAFRVSRSRDFEWVHKALKTRRFNLERFHEYEGYWRFTVVRDPLKRLLSCYTDRVLTRNELHNSAKLQTGEIDLPKEPDPDFFFQNLRDYMKAASVIRHHAYPTVTFIGNKLGRYSKIYTVSEIPKLEADFSDRLGQDISIPRLNESKGSLDFDDLAGETKTFLRDYLQRDYRVLHRQFDNPFA